MPSLLHPFSTVTDKNIIIPSPSARTLLFGFLLFGHQAVGPYRTNTACAPMAAYTWTPSRNPAARIPPVPCVLNKALLLGDIAGPTLFSVIGTPPRKGGTWRVPPARGPPPSVLTPGRRTGTPTPLAGGKAVSLGEGDQTRHRWHSWLLFLPFSAVDNNF